MFGFFKKKAAPPLCPGNPGIGTEAKVAFATGDRSWTEKVDVVRVAAEVLRQRGFTVKNEKTWLHHTDSGFMLSPQLVGLQPLDDGGVRTVTTIQSNHATLAPDGLFEYQHSAGDSLAEAIAKGIDQWVQMDFVTLLEALRRTPEACTAMEMQFPSQEGQPPRTRRAVLGPVAHFQEKSPNQPESCGPDEHPFCACCLLTNSFEAFKELIEGDGFYGLRLFAARDETGAAQADCRVNGEDWERGAEALRQYVCTWPAAGFEFRKQYVVLQNLAAPTRRS